MWRHWRGIRTTTSWFPRSHPGPTFESNKTSRSRTTECGQGKLEAMAGSVCLTNGVHLGWFIFGTVARLGPAFNSTRQPDNTTTLAEHLPHKFYMSLHVSCELLVLALLVKRLQRRASHQLLLKPIRAIHPVPAVARWDTESVWRWSWTGIPRSWRQRAF